MPCLSRIRPSTFWFLLEHLRGCLGETEARHADRARSRAVRRTLRRTARRCSAGRSGSSTAVAWVWSTNFAGMKACSSISTDGEGACGSMRKARCTRAISSSVSGVARAQRAQRLEPHRRQAGGLDRAHVPAGAFDAEHRDVVAEQVARASSSARCCRRRAARAWRRARAVASCRRAAPGRRRRRPCRNDRWRPWRRARPNWISF